MGCVFAPVAGLFLLPALLDQSVEGLDEHPRARRDRVEVEIGEAPQAGFGEGLRERRRLSARARELGELTHLVPLVVALLANSHLHAHHAGLAGEAGEHDGERDEGFILRE